MSDPADLLDDVHDLDSLLAFVRALIAERERSVVNVAVVGSGIARRQ
jgi:hypothetical protein